MPEETPLLDRVCSLIVRQLRLKISPHEIGADALLFGGDLGLDSIDALELVVGLEKEFGVSITDQKVGETVLRTARTIADHLASNGVS